MLRYVLLRIVLFIPTLFFVSLLTFFIAIHTPGDPVRLMLKKNKGESFKSKTEYERVYATKRKELNLNLPLFYFSVTNSCYIDTIHRLPFKSHRTTLNRLSQLYGSGERTMLYYESLRQLEKTLLMILSPPGDDLKLQLDRLYSTYTENNVIVILKSIVHTLIADEYDNTTKRHFSQVLLTYQDLISSFNWRNKYIPKLNWYGNNNQYHVWATKFLRGDFGISFQNKQPVHSKIYPAFKWSLLLSILSISLAYIISIPIGVQSAMSRNKKSDKLISTILFMIYSLPSFWVATLLIQFFGSGGLGWFPTFGLGSMKNGLTFWKGCLDTLYHLILPLFCLTYGSFAFISRHMRSEIIETLRSDYILTARSKGLSNHVVIWKHAYKNSLIPIITLFTNIFPAVLSGAFIIEVIFSIPGLGQLMLNAIFSRDFPTILAVLIFTSLIMMIANLLADILYKWVDPRVTFT